MQKSTHENGGFVGLLIDTQIFVWVATSDRRLSTIAAQAIGDGNTRLFTSSVVAWEFADLERRGRFPPQARFEELVRILELEVLAFPADAWRLVTTLPQIHRDPVDRMLIAHALHADLTLVTADATIRSYPVQCLW